MRAANPRLAAESVRAGGVDATDHPAIRPYLPNPGLLYNIMDHTLMPAIRTFYRGLHAPTEPLGRFLVETAMGKHESGLAAADIVTLNGGLRLVENGAFRRMMGLQ